MRSSLFVMATLFGMTAAAVFIEAQATQRHRLDQPAVLQGYPCDRGDAWFFANGRLNRCAVSRDSKFGESWIPAGSIIVLRPDGTPLRAMLKRATDIHGVRCAGDGLLGPAEGSSTDFYSSGKLKQCFLSEDRTVEGTPCAAGGFWKATRGHEWPVEFGEDGRLKSCGLSADFRAQHRGDRFIQKQ